MTDFGWKPGWYDALVELPGGAVIKIEAGPFSSEGYGDMKYGFRATAGVSMRVGRGDGYATCEVARAAAEYWFEAFRAAQPAPVKETTNEPIR